MSMKKLYDLPADIDLGVEVDWREDGADEEDPDDKPLAEAPEDVVALLGFNPHEVFKDDPRFWETASSSGKK